MKFAVGLLCGILIGGSGAWLWLTREPTDVGSIASVDASPATGKKAPKKKVKRKGKRPPRPAGSDPSAPLPSEDVEYEDDVPENVEVSAADRVMVTVGPSLKVSPRSVDMSNGEESRNLTQSEIDAGFSPEAQRLTRCVTSAIGTASFSGVQVTVSVLVSPQGRVTKHQIQAPRYLISQGLTDCMRPLLSRLSFEAVGRESVLKVPFRVD